MYLKILQFFKTVFNFLSLLYQMRKHQRRFLKTHSNTYFQCLIDLTRQKKKIISLTHTKKWIPGLKAFCFAMKKERQRYLPLFGGEIATVWCETHHFLIQTPIVKQEKSLVQIKQWFTQKDMKREILQLKWSEAYHFFIQTPIIGREKGLV